MSSMEETSRAEELRMTFTEHLGELRKRLIVSAWAIFICFIVCYVFSEALLGLIAGPLLIIQDHGSITITENGAQTGEEDVGAVAEPEGQGEARTADWTVLNPLEPFLVRLKVSAYGAVILTLPILMYQLCAFVFPGLHPTERKAVRVLLGGSSVLGIAGVAVGYLIIFPLVLPYLMAWAPDWVEIQLRLNETISLILKGLIGFALAFQFPMAVLVLVYMGILEPRTLKQYRKVAIVIMAVLSAFLTPPEPFSMFIMMLPLVILYEVSIWCSYLVVRKHGEEEGGESQA